MVSCKRQARAIEKSVRPVLNIAFILFHYQEKDGIFIQSDATP